jgi:fibro-slime domain-containing protein
LPIGEAVAIFVTDLDESDDNKDKMVNLRHCAASFNLSHCARTCLPLLALLSGVALLSGCGSSDADETGRLDDDNHASGDGQVRGDATSGTDAHGNYGLDSELNVGSDGAYGDPTEDSDRCKTRLVGVIRDFKQAHPDFEHVVGTERGLVEHRLGADGKPVYAHGETPTKTTTGKKNFDQWFRDVPGTNLRLEWLPTFTQNSNGTYTYEDSAFFPIDHQLWGNEKLSHNYHFTYELHTEFIYQGGEVFKFRGDDDVFTFINEKLVVDLGGVHTVQEAEVDLDQRAQELGLEIGGKYKLDFFFAERHTTQSNFRIDTSIVFVDCAGKPVLIK